MHPIFDLHSAPQIWGNQNCWIFTIMQSSFGFIQDLYYNFVILIVLIFLASATVSYGRKSWWSLLTVLMEFIDSTTKLVQFYVPKDLTWRCKNGYQNQSGLKATLSESICGIVMYQWKVYILFIKGTLPYILILEKIKFHHLVFTDLIFRILLVLHGTPSFAENNKGKLHV